jgi:hypothetical protein
MTNKRISKRPSGLAGLLGGIGVAAGAVLGGAENAKGEIIRLNDTFNEVNTPNVYLFHDEGASEGYDESFDSKYHPEGVRVDFYSLLDNGDKLEWDSRAPDSNTTYHTLMQGNGLTYPKDGALAFNIYDTDNLDHSELPDNIFASILKDGVPYTNGSTTYTNIDVRNFTSSIPITLDNAGTVYTVNVGFVPEPGTLSLLAMAGIAGTGVAAYSRLKKRKQ